MSSWSISETLEPFKGSAVTGTREQELGGHAVGVDILKLGHGQERSVTDDLEALFLDNATHNGQVPAGVAELGGESGVVFGGGHAVSFVGLWFRMIRVYPDQHQYYTTNRRRFARFFLFFLFYAVTTIAKTINASTAAMPMTSVTSIPLIHTSLEDYKKKPATRNEPPARSFPSPAGESLILTVDRGVVSSESRVKETLKSAGFLYSHGELRGRRGVESIPRVRRDCDDIAAGLLARGVTVHSESEATSLILLLIIHVCFLLFSQHAFGIPYQHLDYRRRGPSVHESAELFFTSAPGKSPLDSPLRALPWKVYRGGSWSSV